MNPDRFEDPSLKVALKRIYGGERAPAALRERLMRSLEDSSPMSPISQSTIFTDRPIPAAPIRLPFWSQTAYRAAAALFLIALIGIFYYASDTSAASPIQQDALLAMVATHDQCCAGEHEEHQDPELPVQTAAMDRATVGRTLSQKLKQAVWVPDLTEEGFTLAAAAICTVGAKQSAHLIYESGEHRISIFSMSGEGCSSKEGACGQELRGHVIAGVARAGLVHCIVAHCPQNSIKQDQVNQFLKNHENEVIAFATPQQ